MENESPTRLNAVLRLAMATKSSGPQFLDDLDRSCGVLGSPCLAHYDRGVLDDVRSLVESLGNRGAKVRAYKGDSLQDLS